MGFRFTPEEAKLVKRWHLDETIKLGSGFRFKEWIRSASAHVRQSISGEGVHPTIEEFVYAIRNGDVDEMRNRMAKARITAKELLTLGDYYGFLIEMMERENIEVHDGPDGPVIIRVSDEKQYDGRRHGSVGLILESPLPDRQFTMWECANETKPGEFNTGLRQRIHWNYGGDPEYHPGRFDRERWDEVFAMGKEWVITGVVPPGLRTERGYFGFQSGRDHSLWWPAEEDAA